MSQESFSGVFDVRKECDEESCSKIHFVKSRPVDPRKVGRSIHCVERDRRARREVSAPTKMPGWGEVRVQIDS